MNKPKGLNNDPSYVGRDNTHVKEEAVFKRPDVDFRQDCVQSQPQPLTSYVTCASVSLSVKHDHEISHLTGWL